MNILFIQQTYNLGGVNVVSAILANKFIAEGYGVSIFAFSNKLRGTESIISPGIRTYIGVDHKRFHGENVRLLRAAVIKESPDLIVNNWGLPWRFITTIRLALFGLKKKPVIWSMYHSAPQANSTIIRFEQKGAQQTGFARWGTLAFCKAIRLVTALSFRYVYRHSAGYILLSNSYVKEFCEFTRLKCSEKIWGQVNPITISPNGFELNPSSKHKELLFVGRIEPQVKKVFRLLDVWKILSVQFHDWHLTIVGDGPDRERLEKLVRQNGLERVAFEGKQQPVEYYKRASVLCLCSDFEGFPLVVGEAMSFGCLPVVYGSFSSIYDIVDNGIDGIIVGKQDNQFSAELMAKDLADIMENQEKRYQMMRNAIKKSEQFSIDTIYKQWKEKIEQKIQ